MNKPIVIAAVGAVVVAVAIGWNVMEFQQESKPAPSDPAPAQQAEQAEDVHPTFDVVRVNPRGDTVIAGRAQPGASVEILDGDSVIGTVTADSNGEWVFVPTEPLAAGDRQLSLRMLVEGQEAVLSDQVVMLTVPENAAQPLVVLTDRTGAAPSRVLQRPEDGALSALSVDAVDYSEDGKTLTISGRAPENARLRLYLNNAAIGDAAADDRGNWTMSPSAAIVPGVYTLRLDHIDERAKVLARMEVPFSRAEIKVAAQLELGDFIVVQPGNSLWRLARRTYGAGTRYTDILAANRDQIRNADLIYPGQVFTLPKAR